MLTVFSRPNTIGALESSLLCLYFLVLLVLRYLKIAIANLYCLRADVNLSTFTPAPWHVFPLTPHRPSLAPGSVTNCENTPVNLVKSADRLPSHPFEHRIVHVT